MLDGAGLIVNISLISATLKSVNQAEHCISKAGVSMLTKLFTCRLGEFNIPVYKVQPGIAKTDMSKMVNEKYDKMLKEVLCLTASWDLPNDVEKLSPHYLAVIFYILRDRYL